MFLLLLGAAFVALPSVEASTRTAEISNKRYQAGLVSYLEVVDSDRTKLQIQREAAQILGHRLVTSVQLVKALGGGWADSTLRASADVKR
jgi:multidrug efflux system outer membrane protein